MNKTAYEESTELTEVSPFPILKCDGEGRLVLMNARCSALLDHMRVPHDRFFAVLPERYSTILKRALRQRKTCEAKKRYDHHVLHFIFAPAKDNRHVFIFINDLTREEEIKTHWMQSEKMASLGLLVAGLAHEINTPMGSIHSNNDILSRAVSKMRKLADDQGKELNRILGILEEVCRNNDVAAERIMSIVRNLKNFARLDEAERKSVNLHEGLDSTLTLVQHKLKNRIRVVKEYADLPEIECFPNQLNQMFMNILVNAAQAIKDRGTITIKTFRDVNCVKIAIRDTGAGIAPGNLSKVFDPGFTTKGVGIGTGLGLSICYRIVQDHHGKIEVDSSSSGTTFTITLPLKGSNSKNA